MDQWIHDTVTLRAGFVADIASWITALGTFWICLVILGVALWRRWAELIGAALALGVTRLVVTVLKSVIDRERPPVVDQLVHATGQAMPSGHSANAACVAVFAMMVVPRLRWPALVFAALVGLTRILLGVHWATDVIAGWAVGALISWACARSVSPVSRRFPRRSSLVAPGS